MNNLSIRRTTPPMLLLAVILAAVVLGTFPACQAFSVGGGGGLGNNMKTARTLPIISRSMSSSTEGETSTTTTITKAKSKVTSPQLLEFREPTTGVLVKLVGCMHYNPTSIKLTKDVINELAGEDRLGSVVIESCDIRWNQTKTLPPFAQAILESEMKAACELALSDDYQRPVVLGDQRINITLAAMKNGFQETVSDLTTPWNGGWGRYWNNITTARAEVLPSGNDAYLNPFAFLDPFLLLAAPVSLIKYPLSYFFKSPLKTSAFFAVLFAIDQTFPSDAAATMLDSADAATTALTVEDFASLAVSALEIVFFARLFLKDLLLERNQVLAQNILEQCKLYQATGSTTPIVEKQTKSFWNIFDQTKTPTITSTSGSATGTGTGVVYVEDPGNAFSGVADDDKAVVAVLGMAHCNGIANLLLNQKVTSL